MHGDALNDAMEVRILKAITLRNLPSELAKKIENKANKNHTSMNKAVIELLEENLGGTHAQKKRNLIYHDLDHLAGLWSKLEADRFDKGLTELRKIDQELWR